MAGDDQAGRTTVYHLTDNPRFKLDDTFEPQDNSLSINPRDGQRGLYVGRPERWAGPPYGYKRPYVVQLSMPSGTQERGRWGGENFIPASSFGDVKVERVMPYDHYIRREYSSPGETETHMGKTYDTGESLDRTHAWNPKYPESVDTKKEIDTRYPQQWSDEDHENYLKARRDMLHDFYGWGWNEFNENGTWRAPEDDEYDDDGELIRRDREGNKMTREKTASWEEPPEKKNRDFDWEEAPPGRGGPKDRPRDDDEWFKVGSTGDEKDWLPLGEMYDHAGRLYHVRWRNTGGGLSAQAVDPTVDHSHHNEENDHEAVINWSPYGGEIGWRGAASSHSGGFVSMALKHHLHQYLPPDIQRPVHSTNLTGAGRRSLESYLDQHGDPYGDIENALGNYGYFDDDNDEDEEEYHAPRRRSEPEPDPEELSQEDRERLEAHGFNEDNIHQWEKDFLDPTGEDKIEQHIIHPDGRLEVYTRAPAGNMVRNRDAGTHYHQYIQGAIDDSNTGFAARHLPSYGWEPQYRDPAFDYHDYHKPPLTDRERTTRHALPYAWTKTTHPEGEVPYHSVITPPGASGRWELQTNREGHNDNLNADSVDPTGDLVSTEQYWASGRHPGGRLDYRLTPEQMHNAVREHFGTEPGSVNAPDGKAIWASVPHEPENPDTQWSHMHYNWDHGTYEGQVNGQPHTIEGAQPRLTTEAAVKTVKPHLPWAEFEFGLTPMESSFQRSHPKKRQAILNSMPSNTEQWAKLNHIHQAQSQVDRIRYYQGRPSPYMPQYRQQPYGNPAQHPAGSTVMMPRVAYMSAEYPLSWDAIGEMHPEVYGDPEVHGDSANGADGEGIGWAAAHLAFDRPGHGDDDRDEGSWDLGFRLQDVPVSQIDYARHGPGDSRVNRARQGYRETPHLMPPPVLVHRHGVYQVADGHHRGEAAHLEGLDTIPAYVTQSPHEDEPFEEGHSGPFHGAEPAEPMQHEAAWFHGTNHKFEPGDMVETGHPSNYGSGPSSHVHFTNNEGNAYQWAQDASEMPHDLDWEEDPQVYEVEPTGNYEQDPAAESHADFRSRYPLRVIRRVAAVADESGLKAAGIAVIAMDTGRVLMQQRALNPLTCPCGRGVTWDEMNGYQHDDGSVSHDLEDGDVADMSVSEALDQGHTPFGEGNGEEDEGLQATAALEYDPNEGTWEFPGGKLDEGESPRAAAIREFREEVGQDLPSGVFVGAWVSPGGLKALAAVKLAVQPFEQTYGFQDNRGHTAPSDRSYNASLDDLEPMMPGYYDHPEHYTYGSPGEWEAYDKARKARGNPDKRVRIYRAVPHGISKIYGRTELSARFPDQDPTNLGEWVSTSKEYAQQHALSEKCPKCGGHLQVISGIARAGDLLNEGYPTEFGYVGDDTLEHTGSNRIYKTKCPEPRKPRESKPKPWRPSNPLPGHYQGAADLPQRDPRAEPPMDHTLALIANGWTPRPEGETLATPDFTKISPTTGVTHNLYHNGAGKWLYHATTPYWDSANFTMGRRLVNPGDPRRGWAVDRNGESGQGSLELDLSEVEPTVKRYNRDYLMGSPHGEPGIAQQFNDRSTFEDRWGDETPRADRPNYYPDPEAVMQRSEPAFERLREGDPMAGTHPEPDVRYHDFSVPKPGEPWVEGLHTNQFDNPPHSDPNWGIEKLNAADPDYLREFHEYLDREVGYSPEDFAAMSPREQRELADGFGHYIGDDDAKAARYHLEVGDTGRRPVRTATPGRTVRVLRIEKPNGQGPYGYGGDSTSQRAWGDEGHDVPYTLLNPLRFEDEEQDPDDYKVRQRQPYADKIPERYIRGRVFGFLPQHNVGNYFNPKMLRGLHDLGYGVSQYDVPGEHVLLGRTQVAWKPEHATMVSHTAIPEHFDLANMRKSAAGEWQNPEGWRRWIEDHEDDPEWPEESARVPSEMDVKTNVTQPMLRLKNDVLEYPWESADAMDKAWKPEDASHPLHHLAAGPVYKGFIYLIQSERDIDLGNRAIHNPDDPDGDMTEQSAWWDIEDAKNNPALRKECREGTPWKELEMWADQSVRNNKEIKESFAKLAGKCSYCKEPAIKEIKHSEGMGLTAVCDKHLAKGKEDAEHCTPDGTRDPSNINWVHDAAVRPPLPEGSGLRYQDAEEAPYSKIVDPDQTTHFWRWRDSEMMPPFDEANPEGYQVGDNESHHRSVDWQPMITLKPQSEYGEDRPFDNAQHSRDITYVKWGEPICEHCYLRYGSTVPAGSHTWAVQKYHDDLGEPKHEFKPMMPDVDARGNLRESKVAMPTTQHEPVVIGTEGSGEGAITRKVELPSGTWHAKSPVQYDDEGFPVGEFDEPDEEDADPDYWHNRQQDAVNREVFASKLGRAISNPDDEPLTPEVIQGTKASDPGPTAYSRTYPQYRDMQFGWLNHDDIEHHINSQRGQQHGFLHTVLGDGDKLNNNNMLLLGDPMEESSEKIQKMPTVSIDHTRTTLPAYAEARIEDPGWAKRLRFSHPNGEASDYAMRHFVEHAGRDTTPKAHNPLAPGDAERAIAASETMRPWAREQGVEHWLDAAQDRMRGLGEKAAGTKSLFPYRMAHEQPEQHVAAVQKTAVTWIDTHPADCGQGCMVKKMKLMDQHATVNGFMIDHRPHGGRVRWKVTGLNGHIQEQGKARNTTQATNDMLDAYGRVAGGMQSEAAAVPRQRQAETSPWWTYAPTS